MTSRPVCPRSSPDLHGDLRGAAPSRPDDHRRGAGGSEQTSPELVSDISENGITLTGGCSQIWGMDLLIAERTGIGCVLADDPDACIGLRPGQEEPCMDQPHAGRPHQHCQKTGDAWLIWRKSEDRAKRPADYWHHLYRLGRNVCDIGELPWRRFCGTATPLWSVSFSAGSALYS